jgi:hypothetical protein
MTSSSPIDQLALSGGTARRTHAASRLGAETGIRPGLMLEYQKSPGPDAHLRAGGRVLVRRNESPESMRCESETARAADELEELSVPFGVDTWMKVVSGPRWNLDAGSGSSRVEVVQAAGPARRPGIHECSKHPKIDVPAPTEHVRGFGAQTEPLREPLDGWDPRPELVHIAAEVHDVRRELRSREPRLVRGDESKGACDKGIGGRVDLHFGRDAVPGPPLFIRKTDPHQL